MQNTNAVYMLFIIENQGKDDCSFTKIFYFSFSTIRSGGYLQPCNECSNIFIEGKLLMGAIQVSSANSAHAFSSALHYRFYYWPGTLRDQGCGFYKLRLVTKSGKSGSEKNVQGILVYNWKCCIGVQVPLGQLTEQRSPETSKEHLNKKERCISHLAFQDAVLEPSY